MLQVLLQSLQRVLLLYLAAVSRHILVDWLRVDCTLYVAGGTSKPAELMDQSSVSLLISCAGLRRVI